MQVSEKYLVHRILRKPTNEQEFPVKTWAKVLHMQFSRGY